MSNIAIFIAATADELKNGQLPGDLKHLYNQADEAERVVHLECVLDAPGSEKLLASLSNSGAQVTILPGTSDAASSVISGLLSRLHEYVTLYPHVSQFILAGANVDRLPLAASYLRRAGCSVIIAGPERNRLDAVRHAADDVTVWGSGGRGSNASRDNSGGSDEKRSAPDPYEVLVDEVSKSRKHGRRVLLTSLKQRMRKRIRRFDETRLKDKDGRPMRKFKDFVVDAANRGLIQLIENGNSSHVLMPGEEFQEDEEDVRESTPPQTGDPLLDAVDLVERNAARAQEGDDAADDDADEESGDAEGDVDSEEEEEDDEGAPLQEDDFETEELDEDVDPPAVEFMELIESLLSSQPLTLGHLIKALDAKKTAGEIQATNDDLRDSLQAAFHNELLEAIDEETPARYQLADDWRDLIDYL